MEKKRLAILVTMDEADGNVRIQMETDALTIDDLKLMGFAAVGSVAEAVVEKLETREEGDKYFNALINKLEDMREELE